MNALTDHTFSPTLATTKTLLVEFTAAWCPPCRALEPTLEAIDNARDDVDIYALDVETSPETAERFGVRAMPTLILFRDGRPLGQLVGAQPRALLDGWLSDTLGRQR